ncbi:hypothetical protein V2J09_017683 [Rumex salicifolius]
MEEAIWKKMTELRSVCVRDIEIQQPRMDAYFTSFRRSLQSINSKTEQATQNQVELGNLKAQLREAKDQLVKALAAKTRKEAKRMAVMDSVSVTKAKVEEINRTLLDQKNRKDEYARIISQQLEALTESEEKIKQDITGNTDEIEEACAWYNNVLGLRIEGGHGVKFTFTNINRKCLSEEYSFTVRHENDVYSLLDCNPQLNDIKELVEDLNKTNGLFKFVRTMRAKFQQASASGSMTKSCITSPCQNTVELALSAPSSLLSSDSRSKSPEPLKESNRTVEKPRRERKPISSFLSPEHVRRSPRFRAKN